MGIRVLIAEPDEPLQQAFGRILARQGFDVMTASDGPSCIAQLREFRPDVLVLEPALQEDWGGRLLSRMRQDPEVPCVPVIILTRGDPGPVEYPVQEVYVKPMSLSRLAARIQHVASQGLAH